MCDCQFVTLIFFSKFMTTNSFFPPSEAPRLKGSVLAIYLIQSLTNTVSISNTKSMSVLFRKKGLGTHFFKVK